ncbi:MAG TPA: hypothetical protein VLH56_00440 [Dissulfurispiraceae bacterium]|nr:hypothetical protein [Dissulfurispiraceae bacterium]
MRSRKTIFPVFLWVGIAVVLLVSALDRVDAVSPSPPAQCREDRALVRTGDTIVLACIDSSAKADSETLPDEIPVFREHRCGHGESPVFPANSPNRIMEAGKIRITDRERADMLKATVLESRLHTGDTVYFGTIRCVICTVVCDNMRKRKE